LFFIKRYFMSVTTSHSVGSSATMTREQLFLQGFRATPVGQGLEAFKQTFSKISKFILESPIQMVAAPLIGIGSSALAAGLFTAVAPWGGAIYGVTNLATTHAVSWLVSKLGCQDNALIKTIQYALPTIAGIGAGCGAIALAGFTLTPGTVIALVAGSFVFTCAGALALGVGVVAAAGAVAVYDGFQAYKNANTSLI
jgi:hypothetical protein